MNNNKVISKQQEELAMFAKALSHPIRIFIIEFLEKGTCCYSGDLSKILPIAKSTLSQHLKALKNAGLIQGEIETPKIKYCLDTENWKYAKKLFSNFFRK